MEEEELHMIEEEHKLQEELFIIQNKHKDVKLVYEKVVENIKHICKMEITKKQEEIVNHSEHINNTTEGTVNDSYISQTAAVKTSGPSEEDLAKSFFEHLETTKAMVEHLHVNVGKKEFNNMLKERGEKSESTPNKQQNKREKNKDRQSKKHIGEGKSNPNSTASQSLITNYEYAYSDEDIKEDDKRVKEEYGVMAHEFKKIVKKKFICLNINI
jgi:hypothetical protein